VHGGVRQSPNPSKHEHEKNGDFFLRPRQSPNTNTKKEKQANGNTKTARKGVLKKQINNKLEATCIWQLATKTKAGR
jgi:hypothetical protein